MKTITEILYETLFISVLNVSAVYVAAFTYHLNWSGVLCVMILVSLLTASITHMFLSKFTSIKGQTGITVNEGYTVLLISLLCSLAVLIILIQRFNFPEALGIALLSGILSSLMQHILRV